MQTKLAGVHLCVKNINLLHFNMQLSMVIINIMLYMSRCEKQHLNKIVCKKIFIIKYDTDRYGVKKLFVNSFYWFLICAPPFVESFLRLECTYFCMYKDRKIILCRPQYLTKIPTHHFLKNQHQMSFFYSFKQDFFFSSAYFVISKFAPKSCFFLIKHVYSNTINIEIQIAENYGANIYE